MTEEHNEEPVEKPDAATENDAHRAVENQCFDSVCVQPQPMSPTTPQPPGREKTDKVHQAVPMDFQWAQCNGYRVYLRILKHKLP